NTDDEESVGGNSATAKIGLQDIRGDEQSGRDHQAKRRKGNRAEMKVRDHRSVIKSLVKSIHERFRRSLCLWMDESSASQRRSKAKWQEQSIPLARNDKEISE